MPLKFLMAMMNRLNQPDQTMFVCNTLKFNKGAREMAQGLRVHAAFPKDLVLIPGCYMATPNSL